MDIRLHLPKALEEKLLDVVCQTGKTTEAFVLDAIEEKLLESETSQNGSNQSLDAWKKELEMCVALHPQVEGDVDDSRDRIYADSGE